MKHDLQMWCGRGQGHKAVISHFMFSCFEPPAGRSRHTRGDQLCLACRVAAKEFVVASEEWGSNGSASYHPQTVAR